MSASPHAPPGDPPAAPLRVAVDATPLLGNRTGVGAVAAEIVAGLGRRGDIDAIAYAATWRGRRALAGHLPAGVRAVSRPMAARPLRAAWARLDLPPIELWTGTVDVVHGTNFVVPPARRAARVVTVHDLTPLHFPELCTDDTRRYPGLLRQAIEGGAFVHTVSAFVAAEVVEHLGADPGRVVAVLNGLRPSPLGDAGRGQLLAGADRYILAVGTVEPRKNLPSLVRAFDALAPDQPDLRLVIAGGSGWGDEDLGAALAAARHGHRVVRLGWVDERIRSDLLAGAAALAFPSVYEGFGLPPLEAMAAGTPVVATRTGAIPEVVGEAALLVPPRDHDALAGALHRLLDEPATAERLVEAGRRRVSEFSWERTIDGLVDLYRRATTDI